MIAWSTDAERNRRVVDRVLRALPRWFGLEEPLRAYVEESAVHPTAIATFDGDDVGFLTLRRNTTDTAEISAMGIVPGQHRRGLGRALVEAAAALAARDGARLLQVKTLGPSRPIPARLTQPPGASTKPWDSWPSRRRTPTGVLRIRAWCSSASSTPEREKPCRLSRQGF